jgi:hypothetical protein
MRMPSNPHFRRRFHPQRRRPKPSAYLGRIHLMPRLAPSISAYALAPIGISTTTLIKHEPLSAGPILGGATTPPDIDLSLAVQPLRCALSAVSPLRCALSAVRPLHSALMTASAFPDFRTHWYLTSMRSLGAIAFSHLRAHWESNNTTPRSLGR